MRRARGSALLHAAALCAAVFGAACSEAPSPPPAGVGPADAPRAATAPARRELQLSAPATEAPVPPPDPAPVVVAPPPTPVAPVVGPDIADLGPFEVTTWADARARAEKRVTLDNARAELAALRAEIEGRP